MIARPLPSRRVLAELVALYPVSALQVGPGASSAHRAFAELIRLLDRQAAARQTGGRNGSVVCARDGHARITLPLRRMSPLGLSVDAAGPRVTVKPGDLRRRLRRARRHRRYGRDPRSALSAEQLTAEVRTLPACIEATATSLLLAPAAGLSDLAVKVCVLVALGEAGPADSAGLPGVHLRVLLADLDRLLAPAGWTRRGVRRSRHRCGLRERRETGPHAR